MTTRSAGSLDPTITRLALDLAARVREAVAPSLGTPGARTGVGVAPGGDVTMAIDEIAEHVTEQCCAEAGNIAFYSEDRGYVEIGRPRAILLIDPIDGTRPAAAGLESCCVSVAVLPPSREATLGEVQFGVVHEIKHDQRFSATRGAGAHVERADGIARADRALGQRRSPRAVLDRGPRRSWSQRRAASSPRPTGAPWRRVRRSVRARAGAWLCSPVPLDPCTIACSTPPGAECNACGPTL